MKYLKTAQKLTWFSDSFADSEEFRNFTVMEVNDDYSLITELNEKNEITGFETGYTQFY